MTPPSPDTLRTVFVRSVDRLITQALLETPDSRLVADLTTLIIPLRLYRVLRPTALVELTQAVFQSVTVRDFILELTEEITLLVEDENNVLQTFLMRLQTALEKTRTLGHCLMPQPIYDELELPNDPPLIELFESNRWLVTIILLRLYFTDTAAFSTIVNTLTIDSAR